VIFLRVNIKLVPVDVNQQNLIIPLDFRRHFISFLKTISANSALFSRFQDTKPGYSPYALSVNFCKIINIDTASRAMIVKPPVYLTFSTGIFDVMTAVCNGAIGLQGKETVLGLKVNGVNLLPLRKINTGSVEFRILGHAALRGKKDYVNGQDLQEAEESINTQMLTRFHFLNQQYSLDYASTDLCPVNVVNIDNLRKGVCFHYGGLITTLQGKIHLDGDQTALQFLYDFGLGTRTGQGFGMLEVVREYE
jgi:CRISPR-associated endoribonuclease Cas6